ncbi:hypothetical protein lerEdw1_011490 [Lerista edwardsae]|nr:hypothetical protein lerEdw1_011490 [Lerista edwardsae]
MGRGSSGEPPARGGGGGGGSGGGGGGPSVGRPRLPTPAMRGAAPERGQERLPPKKRELPAAAASEERVPVGEAPSGRGGRPSQAAPCYSEAGGLSLDQYGLLYKVAVPPASFSPVVNVSPLPPAFGMSASQLLPPQPAALPYSPLHYAQLPPALLQFVGSHYSVPYTVPPGFLPGPLLPASASLAASHIPHLVPYAPLLTEDTAPPPPQAALPSHGLGKSPAAGPQPLDAAQSRIPVYYQMPHLPAGYRPFESPVAGQSPEQPLPDSQLDPRIVPANGVQRPGEGTKETEAMDVGSTKAEGPWPRTTLTDSTDAPFIASALQPARAETPAASQRSTPDMDLEVQRVVGVLASPDYSVGSALQKDGLSPLNLSHREPAGQKVEPAEKGHLQRLPAKSPQEQLCHRQVLHGLRMANGEQASGPLQPAALDGPGKTSPGGLLDADCGPAQGHLPSHFMKGAIIQLATGELKRVEDLQTQDFVRSAEVSGGLKIDSSTVVDVQESPWQGFVTLHFVVGEQQSKVSIDVPPEHPFFVYGQGWSSCSPERTARLFSLSCHRLQIGMSPTLVWSASCDYEASAPLQIKVEAVLEQRQAKVPMRDTRSLPHPTPQLEKPSPTCRHPVS